MLSFDKITSTQTYALDMIARGMAQNRTIVLAQAQSAGRGRYRRTWVSHHGNLYTSFIYTCEERDPRLSYMVAVAIAETLIKLDITPNIKWPNDIFVDDAKISGVLIEYAGDFVVIGIGINIKTNPTVEKYKTTKLAKYANTTPTDLLKILTKNLDKWMKTDFLTVRDRWMELAIKPTKNVKYRNEPAEFIGINENGALVLRRQSQYIFAYGDEIVM